MCAALRGMECELYGSAALCHRCHRLAALEAVAPATAGPVYGGPAHADGAYSTLNSAPWRPVHTPPLYNEHGGGTTPPEHALPGRTPDYHSCPGLASDASCPHQSQTQMASAWLETCSIGFATYRLCCRNCI